MGVGCRLHPTPTTIPSQFRLTSPPVVVVETEESEVEVSDEFSVDLVYSDSLDHALVKPFVLL